MAKAVVNHGNRKASSKWKVTLYNQHAMCGIGAWGKTRRQAFDNAVIKAGDEFIKCGEDRSKRDHWALFLNLFCDGIMAEYNRYASSVSRKDGALCVQLERASYVDWLNSANFRKPQRNGDY